MRPDTMIMIGFWGCSAAFVGLLLLGMLAHRRPLCGEGQAAVEARSGGTVCVVPAAEGARGR